MDSLAYYKRFLQTGSNVDGSNTGHIKAWWVATITSISSTTTLSKVAGNPAPLSSLSSTALPWNRLYTLLRIGRYISQF